MCLGGGRLSDYNLFVKTDDSGGIGERSNALCCYVVVNATPAKYTVYGGIPRCVMPSCYKHRTPKNEGGCAWPTVQYLGDMISVAAPFLSSRDPDSRGVAKHM